MTTKDPMEAQYWLDCRKPFSLEPTMTYAAVREIRRRAEKAGYTVTEDLCFTPPLLTEHELFLHQHCLRADKVLALHQLYTETKAKLDAEKGLLLAAMGWAGINKVERPSGSITLTHGGPRDTFDTKAFKKDYPKLFRQYSSTTYTDDYLTVRRHSE